MVKSCYFPIQKSKILSHKKIEVQNTSMISKRNSLQKLRMIKYWLSSLCLLLKFNTSISILLSKVIIPPDEHCQEFVTEVLYDNKKDFDKKKKKKTVVERKELTSRSKKCQYYYVSQQTMRILTMTYYYLFLAVGRVPIGEAADCGYSLQNCMSAVVL